MTIYYSGESKILRRICEKLNQVPTLGTRHQDAYYGDLGKDAYDHSLVTEGNPHRVTAEDLGLEHVVNQIRLILDAIGALGEWADYDGTFFTDHEGDQLVFTAAENLLAWH